MKKLRISIIIFFPLIFLTACGGRTNQNYIKNVYLSKTDNKYQVEFQIYDFSSQEESYKECEYSSDDIHKISMVAVQDNNLNFRLCENLFIDSRLFLSDFDKVFSLANRLKIPPSANGVCLSEKKEEDVVTDNLIKTPMYNFSQDISGTSGIVGITDNYGRNLGALIIQQGDAIKVIAEKQWKILNMLTGDKSGFSCTVRENEIFVEFDKADVYYSYDNGLKITITLSLKDYRGTTVSANAELIKDFIKRDIADVVYQLYNDAVVKNFCNLDWFCKINNFSGELTDVIIEII